MWEKTRIKGKLVDSKSVVRKANNQRNKNLYIVGWSWNSTVPGEKLVALKRAHWVQMSMTVGTNAPINSGCYHPPPGPTPGDLCFFFRGTTNSPPPSCQKLQIPRPWATEKQQKLQKLKKHILKARLIT